MRRLGQMERKGLNKTHLLIWGLVFALFGIISRSILQNGILQMHRLTQEQLLENLQISDTAMAVATAAVILQGIETCAIPVIAFLLVNGFEKAEMAKSCF